MSHPSELSSTTVKKVGEGADEKSVTNPRKQMELFLVTGYSNPSNQSPQKPAEQDILIEVHKMVLSRSSSLFADGERMSLFGLSSDNEE